MDDYMNPLQDKTPMNGYETRQQLVERTFFFNIVRDLVEGRSKLVEVFGESSAELIAHDEGVAKLQLVLAALCGGSPFNRLPLALTAASRFERDVINSLNKVGALAVYCKQASDSEANVFAIDETIRQVLLELQSSSADIIGPESTLGSYDPAVSDVNSDISIVDFKALDPESLVHMFDQIPTLIKRNVVFILDPVGCDPGVNEIEMIVREYRLMSERFPQPSLVVMERKPCLRNFGKSFKKELKV